MRKSGSEEGATLVEYGLIALVFLALLFGCLEFSYAFYTYHNISDAARKAVRWASVRGSQSCLNVPTLPNCDASATDVTAYVQGIGYPGVLPSGMHVTTKWCDASTTTPGTWTTCTAGSSNAPGNQVQVTVSYTFPIRLPYLTVTSLSLTNTANMVIVQ